MKRNIEDKGKLQISNHWSKGGSNNMGSLCTNQLSVFQSRKEI